MRKPILLLVSLLGSACGFSQSCPSFPACPQATVLYCDYSINDSLLWKAEPYTWSPTVLSPDLYEGAAALSVYSLLCPGGGTPAISYAIFMDLNDDNLEETVIESDQLPPPGCVLFGNIFNPGYEGGDTLRFDGRDIPDSLQFQFALEYAVTGNTLLAQVRWNTEADPNNSILPRMPEGRHRIVWTIRQDTVLRQCQRNFRIEDCAPPVLICKPDYTISINASGEYSLSALELVESTYDLVTPFDLLEFSLREQGAGAGFPLDSVGDPRSSWLFRCPDKGPKPMELWVRDRSDNTEMCDITVTVLADPLICPPRKPVFCAQPFWSPFTPVTPLRFDLVYYGQDSVLRKRVLPHTSGACVELDTLPGMQAFSIVPSSDNNPLNGVSTFDLAQISKHILQVAPLDAPWKLLAADANGNGQVTASDIIELRKLILGINQQLNNNESWRFYPADCNFSANPFTTICPPWYSFQPMPFEAFDSVYYFNAVKIGDVNGSAIPNEFAPIVGDDRTSAALILPDWPLRKGETYRIPLRLGNLVDVQGFQGTLTAAGLQILSIEPGDLPDFDENVYRIQANDIHISWFTPRAVSVAPAETVAAHLLVMALDNLHLGDALRLDEARLPAEAYSGAGSIMPLAMQVQGTAETYGSDHAGAPTPNPSDEAVYIPLFLVKSSLVRVQIFDLAGKLLFENKRNMPAGNAPMRIPSEAFAGPGAYVWRIETATQTFSGRLLRR